MRWLFRKDTRSFYLLNATQFLGALNDNVFKLLVIYLLIHVKGPGSANTILSIAGAVFVIPFLLFSSGSGLLADRMSKRTIIVYTKFLELVVMLYGLLTVYLQSEIGAFIALFLMATQSALFGPSKYGIIPELVDSKMVSKANGSITSMTYLAIILGTFLASFIADVTNKNFVLEAFFCVFIALLGVFTSLGIRRTEAQKSTKKITPLFIYEIYQTLKMSWSVPHLLTSIFGSSFFLFVGAFTQLNIIPFAMQSLGLSEVGGGYLFLSTAVGIAVGAVLAGQLSKDKVEPGLSCISGIFIAIFFVCLHLFSFSLVLTNVFLGLLGLVGGAFLIPFDSFIQVNSPQEKRGQVIAATNFFSFIGVLFAAFCLYFISEKLGLTASSGFVLMGFLTFVVDLLLIGRLSSLFFPFFVRKILKRFRRLTLVSAVPGPSTVILLSSRSWWDPILLFSYLPTLQVIVPGPYLVRFPWINGWFDAITLIPSRLETKEEIERFSSLIKKMEAKKAPVCLFLRSKMLPSELEKYKQLIRKEGHELLIAHGKKEKTSKRYWFFRLSQREITMNLEKESHSENL